MPSKQILQKNTLPHKTLSIPFLLISLSLSLPRSLYSLSLSLSLASQSFRQRTREEPIATAVRDNTVTTTITNMNKMNRPRRDTRMGTAKRGFRSLAVAVTVPVSLTLAAVCLSGSGRFYWALRKPFWLPPLWALHLLSLSSSSFMGLSAWLVWAEGGFHRHAAALPLYLSQTGLGLLWEPVALGMGATRAGLAVGLALLGALLGCSRVFGEVNPLAGDLAKLCLGWAAILALVNLTLIFTSDLSSLNE